MIREILESAGRVDGREKIDGYSVDIMHLPPKGYYAVGKSLEVKGKIAKQFFDTYEEALEHAELEIYNMD